MYKNKQAKVISRVRRGHKHKKAVILLLIIVLLQFAAVEFVLIYNGKSDAEVRTDYLVILGAGIKGETLSLALYERLMTALGYLGKYPDTKVVVSGGQGPHEAITEAEAMSRFLVSRGISNDRILLETHATSTMENFTYSRQLIEQKTGKPPTQITFVTSSFHILRAKMLAERNGFTAHALSAKTPWQAIVQVYVREYFAIFKSLIVDR